MLKIQCLESKAQNISNEFSRFLIGPLNKSQGVTIGNALRRVLLAELEGLAITGVRISDIKHEFSSISDVKEDVIEILLNLKQIILSGNITQPCNARLNFKGPGIVTAKDIFFPEEVSIVKPCQYIANVVGERDLEMEFIIESGKNYVFNDQVSKNLPENFLGIDAVFMPVIKVNFFVETAKSDNTVSSNLENLIIDISTNGSISPIKALKTAADSLSNIFTSISFEENKPLPDTSLKSVNSEEKKVEFRNILVEELELSVRAYNCLKRANINTLADLLSYSEEELLEFKNFGQKSADEVIDSLSKKFNQILKKN